MPDEKEATQTRPYDNRKRLIRARLRFSDAKRFGMSCGVCEEKFKPAGEPKFRRGLCPQCQSDYAREWNRTHRDPDPIPREAFGTRLRDGFRLTGSDD